MYYLTEFDDIISRGFWVILKITSWNLCKPISDIINYSTCICPFESGQCGKEGKNYKNMNISKTKRAFKKKKKTFFIGFEGLTLHENIKNR